MVWGCISAAGTGELQFIEGTMNANMYCDILKQRMIPSLRRLGRSVVFQHDNVYIVAKCHFFSVVTWKYIIEYLQKCEGCTHFCEILYNYKGLYINLSVCCFTSVGQLLVTISLLVTGPRVWRKGGEAHSTSCLKSSVKFPQSVMIRGAMSSAGVGPLCFLKTNVTAPVYQELLEHLMLPAADQLFKDAAFLFPAGFGTCPHWKKHQKLVKWPWCWCAWLASKLTRPEPHR